MKLGALGTLGALLFLFARIFTWESAPFLNDEPRLLVQVDQSYAEGKWPSIGAVGSQPIPYGPVPHWFYQTVRTFSDLPQAPFVAHGVLFFVSHLLLGWVIFQAFGFATACYFLLLAASSPWLFMYSKMPWEVLLLVPASALVAVSLWQLHRGKWPLALSAFVWAMGIAVALGTHLMGLSLLVASASVFLDPVWRMRRRRDPWIFFGLGAVGVALFLFPYGRELVALEVWSRPATAEHWGSSKQLWWSFVKSMMYLSPWQMKYFLAPEEAAFSAYLGTLVEKIFYLDVFGWLGKALAWVSVASVFLGAFLPKPISKFNFGSAFYEIQFPILLVFGGVGVLFHILLLQFVNVATYPHYFLPFWWAPFLFLAILPMREVFHFFRISLAAGNLVFLILFSGFLAKNQGTRGFYYGSFFSNQKRIVEELCGSGANRVDLSEVTLRHYSITYFSHRIPECSGKALEISEKPLSGTRFFIQYGKNAQLEGTLLK